MTFANIGYNTSYARPVSNKPNDKQKLSHGGARNFADRVTYHINKKQSKMLRDAWGFADWQGQTLNYWLTIHWGKCGLADWQAGQALSQFLDYVRDFLRKRGIPVLWLYVRENGDAKGSHVHILLYLPYEAAKGFHALRDKWLERATRAAIVKGAALGKTLPRHAKWGDTTKQYPFATKAEALQSDSWNCLHYVLKGTTKPLAEALNLSLVEDGGAIIGKRCGASKALQCAAMKKAGYTPPRRYPLDNRPHGPRIRAEFGRQIMANI